MIFDVIFYANFSEGNALSEEIKKRMASAGIDESVKQSLKAIPLMKTKAGPRDGDLWIQVRFILFLYDDSTYDIQL